MNEKLITINDYLKLSFVYIMLCTICTSKHKMNIK